MKDNPFKIQEDTVRDADVGEFLRREQTGDYLDLGFTSKAQQLGRFFTGQKIRWFFFFFLLVFSLLFVRVGYLQIIGGDYYRQVAEGNRLRAEVIRADRGLIYDRFGNLLVKNVSYFFLYLRPSLLPTDELTKKSLLKNIAETLGLKDEELQVRLEAFNPKSDKVLVYENLPYATAIKLLVMSEANPSLEVDYEPRRQYFSEFSLAHILGWLGEVSEEDIIKNNYNYHDRIGKAGLEFGYESILKGENGVKQVEVDALYHEKNVISLTEAQDGADLVLTLDAKAQEKLTEIMKSNAAGYGLPKMAAVILDPRDGGVVALNSLPTYDSNIFTTVLNKDDYNKIISDANRPLLNRVLDGTYPLGSVFKLVVGAAALQEKLIDTKFTVLSTGGILIGDSFYPDWRAAGHGLTNIYWALADSVNSFFYTIGGGNNKWLDIGLGVDKIVDYARKFGLSKLTKIDLPGEVEGFLPSKEWKEKTFGERWYLGDTYNLSIGQGYLLATPLQAVQLVVYFANRGLVYQPHFLKEIKRGDQTEIYQPSVALQNIISADNLEVIRAGMREAVTKGTAQSLQSVPVKVAGKTGTAQFNRNKPAHSWFASFAPYDDPKIAMVVLVEEGGDSGVAVKITREFMEWYFSR
jgi:penicillin-binding protein 2